MPKDLEIMDLPFEICSVWEWWSDLNKTRQSGMDICTVTYTEIFAWANLKKIDLHEFEVDCITAIDNFYVNTQRKKQADKAPSK